MSTSRLVFLILLSIGLASCAQASQNPDEIQFYRADDFNITFALPGHWVTAENPVQENALVLGFHTPDAEIHSMILFVIPKKEGLNEELVSLYEFTASTFAGVREEDTSYEPLVIDGMQAFDIREKDYAYRILAIDDMDRYIILVYQDPDFFDDPDYADALETVRNSVGLLSNPHPYVSDEKDYLAVSYLDGVQIIGYTGSDRRIRIPEKIGGKPVLSIGNEAFFGLDIQYVAIPDTVMWISDRAFSSCGDLRGVTFSDQLLSIGNQAFELCGRLLSVSIPDSVVYIGEGAFIGCERLMEMRLPSSLVSLGACSLAVTNISMISIDEKNPLFQVTDNVLFSKDGKVLIYYPQGRAEEFYQIPEGVETISSFAFAQMNMMPYALNSVSLPNTLKRIDTGALSLIGQRVFVIPSSVKMIGDDAFSKEHPVTLYGERGSTAEAYAKKNGLKFVNII